MTGIAAMTIFWIFVAFYATVKIAFFISVYLVTKSIERRAMKDKQDRIEHNRLVELQMMVEEYEQQVKTGTKDKEIFGARHNRFIA
ncbi:MAG: hypothetical protein HPY50_00865 [Firmicutes bacterium]|nr:hypothetical protein [Bacillota bacterium]